MCVEIEYVLFPLFVHALIFDGVRWKKIYCIVEALYLASLSTILLLIVLIIQVAVILNTIYSYSACPSQTVREVVVIAVHQMRRIRR